MFEFTKVDVRMCEYANVWMFECTNLGIDDYSSVQRYEYKT